PAEARGLVAGIPDARLAVVPGASHLVPVEQPAAVTDLLVHHFSTAWQQPYDTGQTVLPPAAVVPVPAVPPQPVPVAEIAPAAVPEQPAAGPDRYETGLKIRREVLGDAHVDRALAEADDFSAEFQEFRTRSCVTLTALVAGGHLEELAVHTRAALRNGLTPAEIKEVLLQAAVYCGM